MNKLLDWIIVVCFWGLLLALGALFLHTNSFVVLGVMFILSILSIQVTWRK